MLSFFGKVSSTKSWEHFTVPDRVRVSREFKFLPRECEAHEARGVVGGHTCSAFARRDALLIFFLSGLARRCSLLLRVAKSTPSHDGEAHICEKKSTLAARRYI